MLSCLAVLLLHLLLPLLLPPGVLAYQMVKGHNLSLLLHVNHFVAKLGNAIQIRACVGDGTVCVPAASKHEEEFLEYFADEVEENSTAVTWLLLLQQMHLLDG